VSIFLYAVRCNFTGSAARESQWHAWYDGPKVKQMLSLPLFLAVQRFRAAGLDTRRQFLALWQVASPDAFATPEYKAQWGFAEWTGDVADWSRDLYRAPGDAAAQLEVGPAESLYVASFDGLSEADAAARLARLRSRAPGIIWADAIGLDRHAPVLGVRKLGRETPAPLAEPGLAETIFAPLAPRQRPVR
jgi:hypothetical protein